MSHMVELGAKVWLRKSDFSLASAQYGQYGQNDREIAEETSWVYIATAETVAPLQHCLYKIPYVSYAMVNFGAL